MPIAFLKVREVRLMYIHPLGNFSLRDVEGLSLFSELRADGNGVRFIS